MAYTPSFYVTFAKPLPTSIDLQNESIILDLPNAVQPHGGPSLLDVQQFFTDSPPPPPASQDTPAGQLVDAEEQDPSATPSDHTRVPLRIEPQRPSSGSLVLVLSLIHFTQMS
jgi:hypothetical protein